MEPRHSEDLVFNEPRLPHDWARLILKLRWIGLEDEAKRLVVRGFFADVIRDIPVPDLRDEITAAIEQELATTPYAAPTQPTPSTPSTKEN